MSPLQWLNLLLRVLLELGIVAGLAFSGLHTGHGTMAKVLLGMGAPMIGFGLWGAVDFHPRHPETLRLLQELFVSGVAAGAFYSAGAHALGIALGALTIVYHILVYASGARLLNSRDSPAASGGVPIAR